MQLTATNGVVSFISVRRNDRFEKLHLTEAFSAAEGSSIRPICCDYSVSSKPYQDEHVAGLDPERDAATVTQAHVI